jgi:glyoxylase-like metal-dependent hydrolase (beta-lactamase superfamily II)
MGQWKTLNCEVNQVLKGRSNSFLVNSNGNYILVDTGPKRSWNKLKSNIEELLMENKLSYLILTHTHFDHAENTAKIKKLLNPKIIVHKSEEEYLKHGNSPLPKGTNLATGFIIDVIGKKIQSRYKYEPVDPDIFVDEKYDLKSVGINANIIHVPGHSKGSLSIIIDNKIAIVGDAMFGIFGNSIYPPFADNPKIMIESWGKLLDTGCSSFLPGHGKEISHELLEKQYYKHKMIL